MSQPQLAYEMMLGCCSRHGEYRGAIPLAEAAQLAKQPCPTCGLICAVRRVGKCAAAAPWACTTKRGLTLRPPAPKPKDKPVERPAPRENPIAPPLSKPEPLPTQATPMPAIAPPAAAASPPLKRCTRCRLPVEPGSHYPSQPWIHRDCSRAANREVKQNLKARRRATAAAVPPLATLADPAAGATIAPAPVIPEATTAPAPASMPVEPAARPAVSVRFRLELEGDAAMVARVGEALRQAFA